MVRVEWSEVQVAIDYGINGGAQPCHIDLRVSLMGIDDIETTPIPKLHVDLAWLILMVAGNEEASTNARQFGGKIQRPLGANRFDYTITAFIARQFFDLIDNSPVIIRLDQVGGSVLARNIKRRGS